MRRTLLCTPTLLLCLVITIVWLGSGQAMAAPPITPSGLNTQVSAPIVTGSGATQTTQYNITGGTRPGGGTNLFHSFGDFNVPNNNIANFLNNSGLATSNILGRVTGGNLSNIFGTIQTTGFGNANLFLMNPAGFLFGPGATVNVGGMVAFTSADYLRLADGAVFNAIPNPNADALLSAAPVAAFGFLGSNPGAITVQGSQLSVTPGQSISLVGGNITIQSGTPDSGTAQPARLIAPNGTIQLATAASPGEFDAATLQPLPNVNGALFSSFGSVTLAPGSTVDVSQTGNSKVSIRGVQLVVDIQNAFLSTSDPAAPAVVTPAQDTIMLTGGSSISSVTTSADPGPDVQIVADHLQFSGTPGSDPFDPVFTPATPVNIMTTTLESGKAGDITVTANQNMDLSTVSVLSLSPVATGNAGNINLTSTNGNISTFGVFVTSQATGAAGEAGMITVNAPHGDIDMQLSALLNQIGAPGSGASGGGGIQVNANNLTMELFSGIQTDNFSLPVPRAITLNLSGSLSLDGNAIISTIAHGSTLGASDLNITAHNVRISDGSILSTETQGSGPGGRLNIFTNDITVLTGGQIKSGSTSGFDPNLPEDFPPILASGAGGTINIQGLTGPAASVLIDGVDSGIFTNALGTGAAGNTNISTQSLSIQNGGTITAATSGTAPTATGGAITVNANTVNLTTGGTMTASSTGPGPAGQITVQGLASPAQSIVIDGAGSGISTDTNNTGVGGDIAVNANSVFLQNGGSLSAVTSGTASFATGGTITVNANQMQVNSGGLITAATTGAGAGGSVNINAGNTFSSNAGTVSSTTSQANGGNINIAAGDSVTLANGASISASSTGAGNSGNIQISAGNQLAMNSSSITTEANQASGGAIKITTTPGGTVELTDSTITASVLDGTGGGGSVDIDPQFVILQNSQILANSVFGPGGNISITTNLLLPDTTSVISASSQFGQQGTIVIQSPVSPASGKLVPLGQKPLIATALVSQRCAALAGGNASSFTVAGRDSLPAEPGGWVSSPLALSMAEANEGTPTETALSSFSEMAGGSPLLSLRKISPPGFLTQSFAVDSSDGCAS